MDISDLKAYYNTIPVKLTSDKVKKSTYYILYFFKQFFKNAISTNINMAYNKKIHITLDDGSNYMEFVISHKMGTEVFFLDRLSYSASNWIIPIDDISFPKSLIEKLSIFKKGEANAYSKILS